jgi:PAS domain S-box-containing protein
VFKTFRHLGTVDSSGKSQVKLILSVSLLFVGLYAVLDEATISSHAYPLLSLWYPTCGLVFALLFGMGIRYAPVAFVTILLGYSLKHGVSPLAAPIFVAAAMNATMYLAAAIFLRTFLGINRALRRIGDLGKYVLAVTAASFASSTISGMAWLSAGWIPQQSFWPVVLNWFIGGTIGTLSVASFFLMYVFPELGRRREGVSEGAELSPRSTLGSVRSLRVGVVESVLQISSVPLSLWLIAATKTTDQFDLYYLLFLPIIWIAARCGLRGTLPGILCLNIGATIVFHGSTELSTVLKLQILMAVVTITGLYLGALASERAATRDELEERTIYLRALVDNSPLAIVVHNTDGRVFMSNPAFQRMFGFQQAEIHGKRIDSLIRSPEKEDEASEITQRVVNGEPIHMTSVRCRKDGAPLKVELYGVPLVVKDRLAGGIGLYKDISQQARLEEELLLAKKLQAVGQLAGGVAHDFNNVLAIIQGYSESLLERMPKADPLRDSAEEILNASKRGTTLIRQLLAFGRKQIVQPQVLDLNASVQDVAKMLGRLIGADVELSILPGAGLSRIKADAAQIEQIILNLVVNARDAMPKGGKITVETGNVYLHEQYASQYAPVPPGRYAMLAVCDDGIGMNTETLAHIFEPFFTTKEKDKGTGLGLSTVYGIVQQSGGHIRVDSEPGKGSAFRLFFPQVDQEIALPAQAPVSNTVALRGTETVLLLEDEPSFRKMTAEFLERAGYTVLVATSGSEATSIGQLHPTEIHLLLTDVIMPKISGPQLAKVLSVLRPNMRVLFMSGYTDGALEQKDVLSKEVAFIQKPFSWNSLALKIREVLECEPVPEEAQRR